MKHYAPLALAMTLTTLMAVGCEQAETANTEPWTTKYASADAAGTRHGQSNLGTVANVHSLAMGVLEQAASSEYPLLRANAIEAMQAQPEFIDAYVQQGLVDENRGVRFVSAMTVGKLKLTRIAHLVEPLLRDPSQSVQAAAIYALRQCGQKVNLNPLATMLRSSDPEVRGNVALVLGELADRSAVPMIEQELRTGMPLASPSQAHIVELQLAEALVKLGRQSQVDSIRAALYLPPDQQEVSALAAAILGRLNDQGAAAGLWRLFQSEGVQRRPAEVRLAAIRSLAELGQVVSVDMIREYLYGQDSAIRAQAALVLGSIESNDALSELQRLLDDENPLVQVAAAGAVLQIEG